MSNIKLISAILRGKWMIHPAYVKGLLPQVAKILKREPVEAYADDDEQEITLSYAIIQQEGKAVKVYDANDLTPGSIAVLNYSGVVMKEDYCGSPGTATLRQMIKDANANDNYSCIVIHMDSGGGAVDGTFELADDIGKSAKPVYAFIDGIAASAGFAIICKAKEIYASHATAEIGSIGVAVTITDYSKMLADYGITERYYVASTSPHKNKDYLDAEKGDAKGLDKNVLMPLHKIFQETVRAGRPDVAEDALTGKVYFAKQAVKKGLIDGITTFDELVDAIFKAHS